MEIHHYYKIKKQQKENTFFVFHYLKLKIVHFHLINIIPNKKSK